jgi:ABC-type uncharacterized transport system ATPase component
LTSDYIELTDKQIAEITDEHYAPRSAKTIALDRPVAVFVAAQPGAGKTAAAKLAKTELKQYGGYIHVDADIMRERIQTNDKKFASEVTQKDAGRLANALREKAIKNHRNIVEEGTFRKSDAASERIEFLRAENYSVELLAVATSLEESLLGVFQRHEREYTNPEVSNPRFVSVAFCNMAFDGFNETVKKLELSFDRARVIMRNGQILFDSATKTNAQNGVWEAILEGRKTSSEKLHEIALSWQEVKKLAIGRNAEQEYLKEIDAQIKHIDNLRRNKHLESSNNSLSVDLSKTNTRNRDRGAEDDLGL